AVFAGGRLISPKVRAFVDFLVDKLNFDANYMMAQCPAAKLAAAQARQAERQAEEAAEEAAEEEVELLLEKVAR
ncbi:MAG TPA: LysR family transcriptional regulator, partial [Stenotrophomonas sp.]|nr:LysR family transcriptional regulator [Stenotrophomonas sp.]